MDVNDHIKFAILNLPGGHLVPVHIVQQMMNIRTYKTFVSEMKKVFGDSWEKDIGSLTYIIML